jgi:hypothetical protein
VWTARHGTHPAWGLKGAVAGSDLYGVPRFMNVPKVLLSLVALGALLFSLGTGFLLQAYVRSDDPDFSFSWRLVFFWVIAPLGVTLYCAILLGRYWRPLKQAAGDWQVALASVVWLADFALAAMLAFYFWDDAAVSPAQYHGVSIEGGTLQFLGLVALLTSGVCLFAIAERFLARPALYLLGVVVAATYLSEASSSWLGFDPPVPNASLYVPFLASMAVVAVGIGVLRRLRRRRRFANPS